MVGVRCTRGARENARAEVNLMYAAGGAQATGLQLVHAHLERQARFVLRAKVARDCEQVRENARDGALCVQWPGDGERLLVVPATRNSGSRGR